MNNIEKAIHILKEELADGTDLYLTFATAIAALEKQLTNGWIPVSERFPKEDSRILVCSSSGSIDTARYIKYFGKMIFTEWIYNLEGYTFYTDVIAWQSLPEPYKEVSHG